MDQSRRSSYVPHLPQLPQLPHLRDRPHGAALRTFYVSSGGNDGAPGSQSQPWKTVGKVNSAALRPGDAILFEGGATFGDAQLAPRVSGSSAARIWYASYGTGRAAITKGVGFGRCLLGRRRLGHALQIQGSPDAIGSGGSGNAKIEILNNLISTPGIGINSWPTADADWLIAGNTIANTGDSGIVIHGPRNMIAGNTIANTGTNGAISYGMHGIYAEASDAIITGNTIDGFADQGVSTRFRNAQIRDNVIRNGRKTSNAGVGYWPDDPTAGSTLICGNSISAVHYGVLIGDTGRANQYGEHFEIRANSPSSNPGSSVYVPSGRPFSITQSGNLTSTVGSRWPQPPRAQSERGLDPAVRDQRRSSQIATPTPRAITDHRSTSSFRRRATRAPIAPPTSVAGASTATDGQSIGPTMMNTGTATRFASRTRARFTALSRWRLSMIPRASTASSSTPAAAPK